MWGVRTPHRTPLSSYATALFGVLTDGRGLGYDARLAVLRVAARLGAFFDLVSAFYLKDGRLRRRTAEFSRCRDVIRWPVVFLLLQDDRR